MIIELGGFFDVQSREEFCGFLPEGYDCDVLNYYQGEGRIRVAQTVWGIYVKSEETIVLVFEEGEEKFDAILNIVAAIKHAIQENIFCKVSMKAKGVLSDEKRMC